MVVVFKKSAMNKLIGVEIKHLNNAYRTTELLLEQGVLYTESISWEMIRTVSRAESWKMGGESRYGQVRGAASNMQRWPS